MHLGETYLGPWQQIGHHSQETLATEIVAREGVCPGWDQYTSMQGRQHTVSRQHLSGSITSKSVSNMIRKQWTLAHLGIFSPTFFMKIITSDLLYFPFKSVPMVSWMLPKTWGSAKETKSPSRSETEAAS